MGQTHWGRRSRRLLSPKHRFTMFSSLFYYQSTTGGEARRDQTSLWNGSGLEYSPCVFLNTHGPKWTRPGDALAPCRGCSSPVRIQSSPSLPHPRHLTFSCPSSSLPHLHHLTSVSRPFSRSLPPLGHSTPRHDQSAVTRLL